MTAPSPRAYPPASCPRPAPPGTRTVLAHRGASSLAPENTLAAFRRAAQLGARWIELDVDVIADGTVIVIHDTRLDRTTDRTGWYYDLTAADLPTIDAGSWFTIDGARPFTGEPLPTLAQALELAAAEGLNVNIELKSCAAGAVACRRLVDGVAGLLDSHEEAAPGGEVVVSSFNPLLLERMSRRREDTRLAFLTEFGMLLDDWRSYVETVSAEAINPSNEGLDPEKVAEIRGFGYGVNVWTVNSAQRAEQLFTWGATGIFTDRIDNLATLATE